MIHIDGSHGEGGGQILRTALSLSAITGRSICIERIRAGRRQPGLRPQHVTAARATAAICGAELKGDAVGSQTLVFKPQHAPRAGRYLFDVREAAKGGSAGSVTLIFQTLLLPLAMAEGDSQLVLRGGTHVAWSPPFHYLQSVYLPAIAPLGIETEVELMRWGFYPQGGGEMKVVVRGREQAKEENEGKGGEEGNKGKKESDGIEGSEGTAFESSSSNFQPPIPSIQYPISTFQLVQRGELKRIWGVSATSKLPEHIRKRMRQRALERMRPAGVRAEIELLDAPSPGPGAGVFLFAEYEGAGGETVTAGFSGFGRRGKRAEAVADEATKVFLAYHRSGAPVDRHLADQLILPLALAGCAATFRTSEITRHLLTNVWVVGQFLDVDVRVEGETGQVGSCQILSGVV
jgi:RNA 3'-terminal phosphate cyclase (ATP)